MAEELQEGAKNRLSQRTAEKGFLSKVQANKVFLRLLGLLCKRSGLSIEDLSPLVEEICRLCWAEVNKALASSEETLQSELVLVRKQLNQCNLTAMKQLESMKAGYDPDAPFGEDTVIFHEPLEYLDDVTRDLVLALVLDKVRLVESGHAPPSLISALIARSKKSVAEPGSLEDRLDDALDQVAELECELNEAQTLYAEAQRQLMELKRLKLCDDEDKAELEELREMTKRQAIELVEMQTQTAQAEEAFNILRAEYDEVAERTSKRCKLADDMISSETQTDDSLSLVQENKRLKMMLEELQMKMKELLKTCRDRGIEGVDEVAEEIGFREVTQKRTVFDRLYEDADNRAKRIEDLRAKIRGQREKVQRHIAVALQKSIDEIAEEEKAEVPVAQAVANSPLKELNNFIDKVLANNKGGCLAPSPRITDSPSPSPSPRIPPLARNAKGGPLGYLLGDTLSSPPTPAPPTPVASVPTLTSKSLLVGTSVRQQESAEVSTGIKVGFGTALAAARFNKQRSLPGLPSVDARIRRLESVEDVYGRLCPRSNISALPSDGRNRRARRMSLSLSPVLGMKKV